MTRGFLRTTNNAVDIQSDTKALNDYGIATDNIIISDDFSSMIEVIQAEDHVVVCRLSDICMSISDLFSCIGAICSKGATIYSLKEPWLNIMSYDDEVVKIMGYLNMLNREIVSLRTKQGLRKAVVRGRALGRPMGSAKHGADKLLSAIQMYQQTALPVSKICTLTGLKPRLFYRQLKIKEIPLRRARE